MVMIPALLPEAGAVTLHKLQAIEPFRALIEVELWHDQANGAAVIGFQILPIMFDRDEYIVIIQIGKGEIGGIPRPRMRHDELRLGQRFGALQNLANMHAFPAIIVAAPCRNAMNISGNGCARQRQQLFPCQFKGMLHLPRHSQLPIGRKTIRRAFIIQYRPFACQVLSGGKTVLPIREFFNLVSRFFSKQLHEINGSFSFLSGWPWRSPWQSFTEYYYKQHKENDTV